MINLETGESLRPPCTGASASWCPNCGDCRCPRRGGEATLDDDRCPLHSRESDHAEGDVEA